MVRPGCIAQNLSNLLAPLPALPLPGFYHRCPQGYPQKLWISANPDHSTETPVKPNDLRFIYVVNR